MHLLNIRICKYTYVTPTVIFCDQDRYVMKLLNLEMDPTVLRVKCISNKNLDTNYSFLYLLSLIIFESVGKNDC